MQIHIAWFLLLIPASILCLWFGFKVGWWWYDLKEFPDKYRVALRYLRAGQHERLEKLLCCILPDEEPGQVKDGEPIYIAASPVTRGDMVYSANGRTGRSDSICGITFSDDEPARLDDGEKED